MADGEFQVIKKDEDQSMSRWRAAALVAVATGMVVGWVRSSCQDWRAAATAGQVEGLDHIAPTVRAGKGSMQLGIDVDWYAWPERTLRSKPRRPSPTSIACTRTPSASASRSS